MYSKFNWYYTYIHKIVGVEIKRLTSFKEDTDLKTKAALLRNPYANIERYLSFSSINNLILQGTYTNLIKHTYVLTESSKLPAEGVEKINLDLKNEEIRYIYYCIYFDLIDDSTKKELVMSFLLTVFENFKGTKLSSIKKHFGTKPRCEKSKLNPHLPLFITKRI